MIIVISRELTRSRRHVLMAISEGLITAVQPADIAETRGRSKQLIGKFQGPMIKHVPRGNGNTFILAATVVQSPGTASGLAQYLILSIALR